MSQNLLGQNRRNATAIAAIGLGFALAFPTFVTLAYFVWFAGKEGPLQQIAYSGGKIIQFLFPLLWLRLVLNRRITISWPNGRGIRWGALIGIAIFMATIFFYHVVIKPNGWFEVVKPTVQAKISDLGIHSTGRFLALGIFYALIHSFLEEYYWRWFVFGQLREKMSLLLAVIISSAGFMAHHVVLLSVYFGWSSPATYVLSLAVALGGVIWALLYDRYGSLLGPWASHALVDAGIFLVGYDLASF